MDQHCNGFGLYSLLLLSSGPVLVPSLCDMASIVHAMCKDGRPSRNLRVMCKCEGRDIYFVRCARRAGRHGTCVRWARTGGLHVFAHAMCKARRSPRNLRAMCKGGLPSRTVRAMCKERWRPWRQCAMCKDELPLSWTFCLCLDLSPRPLLFPVSVVCVCVGIYTMD